jgi:hypothetical protein
MLAFSPMAITPPTLPPRATFTPAPPTATPEMESTPTPHSAYPPPYPAPSHHTHETLTDALARLWEDVLGSR